MKNKKSDITTSRNKILHYIKYVSYLVCDELSSDSLIQDLNKAKNDFETKDIIANAVRLHFQTLCENEDIEDIEDKEGAIDRLDRSCHFDNEIFVETFDEVFDYVFNDIDPDDDRVKGNHITF